MDGIKYEQSIFELYCTDSQLKDQLFEREFNDFEDLKEISDLEKVSKDKLEQNTDRKGSCLIVIKPEIDHCTSNENKIRKTMTSIDETNANPSNTSHGEERDLAPRKRWSARIASLSPRPPADESEKAVMSAAERSTRYRNKIKENNDLRMAHFAQERTRKKIARLNRTDEQKRKDRESAKIRQARYRQRIKSKGGIAPTPKKQMTRSEIDIQREYWRTKKQESRCRRSTQKQHKVPEKHQDCAKYRHENSNMNDIIYEQSIFKLDCTDSDLNAQPPHSEPIEYEDQKEVSKDKLEQNTDHEDSCLIEVKPEIEHSISNENTIRYTLTSVDETERNPSNISHTQERDLPSTNRWSVHIDLSPRPPAHEFHKPVMSGAERSARFRHKIKENNDKRMAHFAQDRTRKKMARLNRTDEQKRKDRESAKIRQARYRQRKKAEGHIGPTPKRLKHLTRSEIEKQREYWKTKKQESRRKRTTQNQHRVPEKRQDCAKYQNENSNINIIYEQNIFKLDCTDSDLNAPPPHSEPIEYENQEEVSKDKLEQNTDHEDSCLIDIKPEIDHTISNENTIRYTKTSVDETDANPSNILHTQERDLAPRNTSLLHIALSSRHPAHEFHKAVMSAAERSARFRHKIKGNNDLRTAHFTQERIRRKMALLNRTDEQKRRDRELAKIRQARYRQRMKAKGIPKRLKRKTISEMEKQREYWRAKKQESRRRRSAQKQHEVPEKQQDCAQYRDRNSSMNDSDLEPQPLESKLFQSEDLKEVSNHKLEQNTDREGSCLIDIKPDINHSTSN